MKVTVTVEYGNGASRTRVYPDAGVSRLDEVLEAADPVFDREALLRTTYVLTHREAIEGDQQ